jgi:gluconolactonase
MRTITTGLQFPEGPIAMADGSVLVVEIRRGTLSRVAPDGTISVVGQCGGGPNGAAIGPDGACYVVNNGGFEWHDMGGFVIRATSRTTTSAAGSSAWTLKTGNGHDLYTECGGHPLRGPNDIVFDAHGGFWFTDHGRPARAIGIAPASTTRCPTARASRK